MRNDRIIIEVKGGNGPEYLTKRLRSDHPIQRGETVDGYEIQAVHLDSRTGQRTGIASNAACFTDGPERVQPLVRRLRQQQWAPCSQQDFFRTVYGDPSEERGRRSRR